MRAGYSPRETQTAPSKAVHPNTEQQTLQQSSDSLCAAMNLMVFRKKLFLPLDGKLSPASPCSNYHWKENRTLWK